MQDYKGDMQFYQKQLMKKGITKDLLNMDNYAGLTARELQNIVDSARLKPANDAKQNKKEKTTT